jgi:sortase A
MKLYIARQSLRRVLRWTQTMLFACAAAMLSYCAFVFADAWVFQNAEGRKIELLLAARQEAGPPTTPAAHESLSGRINIPRLGLSAMVVEGTGRRDLRRAVGHIAGTALPGQPGNVGIAGHRDTFFRPLRNIREDDIINLTTLFGDYSYRVVSVMVVGPEDVAVLDGSPLEILTLVTCYPFYFVGSAPDRFIVRAERVS